MKSYHEGPSFQTSKKHSYRRNTHDYYQQKKQQSRSYFSNPPLPPSFNNHAVENDSAFWFHFVKRSQEKCNQISTSIASSFYTPNTSHTTLTETNKKQSKVEEISNSQLRPSLNSEDKEEESNSSLKIIRSNKQTKRPLRPSESYDSLLNLPKDSILFNAIGAMRSYGESFFEVILVL